MSWFFNEEEKRLPTKTSKEQHGFFAAAFLMLLAALLTFLGWIFKPLFTWLFDFRGASREVAIIKVSIIFMFLCTVIFGLWQFQLFRDLSLSKSHTLNRNTTGTRIHFPESSYFVIEGNARILELDSSSSKKFLTYSGYAKNTAIKMSAGMCPLVPRNEIAVFSSIHLPKEAEGFVDAVEYTIEQKLSELPFLQYLKAVLMNPSYLFKNKDERSSIAVHYLKEATWGEFERDWNLLFTFPNGHKPFEVRAKFYEHALICF